MAATAMLVKKVKDSLFVFMGFLQSMW